MTRCVWYNKLEWTYQIIYKWFTTVMNTIPTLVTLRHLWNMSSDAKLRSICWIVSNKVFQSVRTAIKNARWGTNEKIQVKKIPEAKTRFSTNEDLEFGSFLNMMDTQRDPIAQALTKKLKTRTLIENDVVAMNLRLEQNLERSNAMPNNRIQLKMGLRLQLNPRWRIGGCIWLLLLDWLMSASQENWKQQHW